MTCGEMIGGLKRILCHTDDKDEQMVLRKAINTYEEYVWHDIEDEYPPEDHLVLVTRIYSGIKTRDLATWDKENGWYIVGISWKEAWRNGEVIAWCELPPKYERCDRYDT